MNIDDPVRIRLNQLIGDYLHIASQHNKVHVMLFEQLHLLLFLFLFSLLRNREQIERNTKTFRHMDIVILLAVPRIGGAEHLWMNGLYDTLCCVLLFPILVYLGASGKNTDKYTTRLCNFLGDISYPLYMVHYPFIYLYYAWVKNENLTFQQSLPGAAGVVIGSIVLAYLCLKLYDIPVRKYLTIRFLKSERKE